MTAAALDRPILMVTGDFVRTGGMDKANFHLAKYFAQRATAVHLVAHRVDPELLAYPNVRFHRSAFPLKSYLLGEFFLSRKGRQVARSLGPSALTIVNGGNCPLPGVNWVHYVHAAAAPPLGSTFSRRVKGWLSHLLYLRLEKSALQRARVIIANSRRTKRDLIDQLGVPPDKIEVVYYGAEPASPEQLSPGEKSDLRARLDFARDKTLFAFIGGLGDRRKGFDVLFAAWLLLPEKIRASAELLVIGTGADVSRWRAHAAEAGAADSIRFLGFRTDVPEILRAVDALVSATRYDAYGLAVQEALCAGLPAIVSRHAGVAEKYPASLNELLLSDPEDRHELAQKMEWVAQNLAALTAQTRETARHISEYSWNDMGDGFRDVLASRLATVVSPTASSQL
jgi:glycosyltransferase involved in cell wall biosynthesis